MMIEHPNKELLKDKEVIAEINRHLWIESEKSGRDIGFDQAAQDWLERFSHAWMEYHPPKKNNRRQAKP
ncbi:MAG: hypothetical protein KC713_02650 [Candidatus Omnitrophica bacterium]|nr:hypothetical protein [Candidatus Omnitrophota bacterium]